MPFSFVRLQGLLRQMPCLTWTRYSATSLVLPCQCLPPTPLPLLPSALLSTW